MEENTSNISKQFKLTLRLLKTAWGIRPHAVIGFFIGSILEICGFLLTIYATAKLSSLLARYVTGGDTSDIWFWLAADIASAVIAGLGFLAMNYYKNLLYFGFTRWSIYTFLSSVSRLDIGDFYNQDIRNQINKVGSGYSWQISNLSGTALDLIYAIMRLTIITAVVSQIIWWIVPIIIVFLIPSLLAESRMAKMQWFVWDAKGDTRHVFWGLEYITRTARGQMELRSTQAKQFVLNKIDSLNEIFYKEQESRYMRASRMLIGTKILEVAGTAIGSIVLLRQFLAGTINLERYFFLAGALLRIGGAINVIFNTLTRMQEHLLFASSFFSLADRTPSIVDQPDARTLANKKSLRIEFDHVSFCYPGQTHRVIDDLCLTIETGEHLALVGENGAGKSTLIKLLMRFYTPTSGRILIDGVDLKNIEIESWYKQIATLFQDFNQYPLSIAENIEIGRVGAKADKKKLVEAAKYGGLSGMVESFDHGWDTVLDASFEKGVEPSGGQWQRVALSRSFYRDAHMIILDEPTSAIDAKAEYDIFNNIFSHFKSKSALIVSHRFSTVRRADRIVVIDNGKIVEQGSHKQLMKNKNLYFELFSKQAEGYLN